ncbi:MAG: hypothetical protein ABSG31_09500 [Tepidisphaeraceae bacterium]
MRTIRFLPFTFLAGMHGFVIFAPYLMLCMGVVVYTRHRRG